MKSAIVVVLQAFAVATSAAVVVRGTASSQLCAGSSFEEGGNWYCRPVNRITYQNVGTSGVYNEVVSMDQQTGNCEFRPKQFSGPLAPFNEPMSLHFRGPLQLKQLAVYMPATLQKRADTAVENQKDCQNSTTGGHEKGDNYHQDSHQKHHERLRKHKNPHHGHYHTRLLAEVAPEQTAQADVKKRACDPIVWVTATINNQVVSWINDWCPDQQTKTTPASAPSPATSTAPPVEAPTATTALVAPAAQPSQQPQQSPQPASSSDSGSTAGTGSFSRTGYYNAKRQESQGLTFLGNFGGIGSGKWTSTFGNTLSYINAEGTSGAKRPTTLSDAAIPSSREVIVMTDQPCDGTCGYVQEGSVAYKGFGGADKIFLMEFSMPHDTGAGGGFEFDMPAVWMLNARIPLTAQYHRCNCWATGCGEFDVFEVLDSGGTKAKSTFHSVFRGGDSNYFERPVAGAIRAAIIYDSASASVSVKVLGPTDGQDFKVSLNADDVQWLVGDAAGAVSSSFEIVD